jgi:hypothetical protein
MLAYPLSGDDPFEVVPNPKNPFGYYDVGAVNTHKIEYHLFRDILLDITGYGETSACRYWGEQFTLLIDRPRRALAARLPMGVEYKLELSHWEGWLMPPNHLEDVDPIDGNFTDYWNKFYDYVSKNYVSNLGKITFRGQGMYSADPLSGSKRFDYGFENDGITHYIMEIVYDSDVAYYGSRLRLDVIDLYAVTTSAFWNLEMTKIHYYAIVPIECLKSYNYDG